MKEVIVWPEELSSVASEPKSSLQAKYAKFNQEITAQEVKVDDVLKMADEMIKQSHPEEMLIMRRREVNFDGTWNLMVAYFELFC